MSRTCCLASPPSYLTTNACFRTVFYLAAKWVYGYRGQVRLLDAVAAPFTSVQTTRRGVVIATANIGSRTVAPTPLLLGPDPNNRLVPVSATSLWVLRGSSSSEECGVRFRRRLLQVLETPGVLDGVPTRRTHSKRVRRLHPFCAGVPQCALGSDRCSSPKSPLDGFTRSDSGCASRTRLAAHFTSLTDSSIASRRRCSPVITPRCDPLLADFAIRPALSSRCRKIRTSLLFWTSEGILRNHAAIACGLVPASSTKKMGRHALTAATISRSARTLSTNGWSSVAIVIPPYLCALHANA